MPELINPAFDDSSSDSDDSQGSPDLSHRARGDTDEFFDRILNPSVLFDTMHGMQHGKGAKLPAYIDQKVVLMTLQQAARDGRIDIVQHHLLLTGKDKKKLNAKDHDQTTALHYAVRYGHFRIVKLLVENGASVNVHGEHGATPLHYAARYVFKTLRKGDGSLSFSEAALSPPGKKNKDKHSMLRNLMIFNAYNGKQPVPKNQKPSPASHRRKNATAPREWDEISDYLGLSNRTLNEDNFSLDNNARNEYGLVNGVHNLATHAVTSNSVPSNTLSLSGAYQMAMPSSAVEYLDSAFDRVPAASSFPLKVQRFSVQPVPSTDPATPPLGKAYDEGIYHGNEEENEGEFAKSNRNFNEVLITENEHQGNNIGFVFDEDQPLSDVFINPYYDSGGIYQSASIRRRRHSAPDRVVPQTRSIDPEYPVRPSLSQSVGSELDGNPDKSVISKATMGDDIGYPSGTPALVFAGAYSSDEISGVNALILPSICQVAVEPDAAAVDHSVETITLSLPDVHVSSADKSGTIAEPVVSAMEKPYCAPAKRLSVVSGRLNLKRDMKLGTLNPMFMNRGLYVGKTLAGIPKVTEDDSILKYLLEKGANQNARDYYGCTPLHYAAMRGNVAAAKQLLSQQNVSTIIEAKDRTKMTPLHYAASNGSLEICKLLLEHGANLRCVDEEDMTPLHFTAMEGYIDIVRLFFHVEEKRGGWKEIAEMVMDKDRDEQTALHLAVENGHMDIVRACIGKGANVNVVKANLMTPLHMACTSGQLDMVQLLLDHDADIEAKNALQETPLHRAALFNRVGIVKFLLDKGAFIDCRDKDNETPLTMAVRKNNVETVQVLLEMNADITVKDANDKTCLYLAAEGDCEHAFKLLIDRPKVKRLLEEFDKNENTPLHVASMKGYIKIVKMLLDVGACIDSKNDTNLTPLHLAAKHGRSRIVKLLLTQDISIVNDEDDASNTPLHLAALEGHVKVVKILLQCGAAVDARNANLWTPLDCAANRGWTWCAEALLDGDSLVNPQDKAKTTPLHLACKEGHVDMINLLLSRKADITRRDHLGRNCLDWAIENKQRDAAIALLSSNNWQAAMRNCSVDGNDVTTPMRKLIKNLPDVAEKVFNQCMTGNNLPSDHPQYEVKCNYEFLEDSFTDWGPRCYDAHDVQIDYKQFVSQQVGAGSPSPSSRFAHLKEHLHKINVLDYGQKQSKIKQNHPLMFMVRSKRTKLLCHPLVTYLLRHKWQACGRYFYYSRLLLYAVFLIFLSCYAMTITTEEFTQRCPGVNAANSSDGNCTKMCLPVVKPVDNLKRRVFVDFGRYAIIFLACTSLLLELAALVRELLTHIHLRRAFDLASCILSIIYGLEGTRLTAHGQPIHIVANARCTMWHRSVGALAVLFSWFSFVIFMRKFPKIGVYIVMFSHLLKTFARFFAVFLLLITAFGLAFHIILYEQDPISFVTPFRSMVKTLLGMLGEFAYDPVFNDYNPTPIPAIGWCIFLVFIVVNWVLLMNLLIGLAVEDIKGVQKQAVLKRLAMQVDLILDIEKAMPVSWQRRLVNSEEVLRPNIVRGFSLWSFWTFKKSAPLTSDAQPIAMERVQKKQGELNESVRLLRNKMKSLEGQHSRMDTMLAALLKHYAISIEYEVDKEEHR